jgi:nitronate monooxygenase
LNPVAGSDPAGRLPPVLRGRLSLPVIAAPMFIVSNPDLVVAQCLAGIVGSFPALNARAPDTLDGWLTGIEQRLAQAKAEDASRTIAPFAVNLIVHASNDRLAADLETCTAHRVPIIITSLRAPGEVVDRVHSYGGVVFHDVTTIRHAEKALQGGVDGLILVCAGAGGHAGALSPFALLGEIRRFFGGPVVLAGAITSGAAILAAQAMGADLAYMGTRFIATKEANAAPGYKAMITEGRAADILYTPILHRHPRQLPETEHRRRRSRPERASRCDEGQRQFRQRPHQSLARHLERRPGRRHHRRRARDEGAGGTTEGGICRRARGAQGTEQVLCNRGRIRAAANSSPGVGARR